MNFISELHKLLVKRCLFPLQEMLKSHTTFEVLDAMEQLQWLDDSVIKERQDQKLKHFIEQSHINTPYYRRNIDARYFNGEGAFRLECFQTLPFLTKSIIRENIDSLKKKTAKNLVKSKTGGSTGNPLSFFIGKNRVSHDIAARWRATHWWRVEMGDSEVVLWGSPIEVGTQDRFKKIRDSLFRSNLLPAFNMSDQNVEKYLRQIKKIKPKMLFGYPSALAYMATYAKKHRIIMRNCSIEVAFVTSEVLYPWQRAIIKEVFSCGVANEYGGREFGFVARECSEEKMHITADDIVVEIIGDDGEVLPVGGEGEIVITHLETEDFPFIRYKTGDVGILSNERCACGLGLPVLEKIVGRSNDLLHAINGARIHPNVVNYILREAAELVHFKVIQKTHDLLSVQLVAEQPLTSEVHDRIVNDFRKILGQEMTVNVDLVEYIKPEKSGKFRYVVNEVDL